MTNNEMTIALAELDGWEFVPSGDTKMEHGTLRAYPESWTKDDKRVWSEKDLPPYLTGYDSTIPLIQRQPVEIRVKFLNELRNLVGIRMPKNKAGNPIVSDFDLIVASPHELCIALLKATNKWKE